MKKKLKTKYNINSFIHHLVAHFAEFGREVGHEEFKDGGSILLEGEFQDLIIEEMDRITFNLDICELEI